MTTQSGNRLNPGLKQSVQFGLLMNNIPRIQFSKTIKIGVNLITYINFDGSSNRKPRGIRGYTRIIKSRVERYSWVAIRQRISRSEHSDLSSR